MQIALLDGARSRAVPKSLGQCPSCHSSVRSACGSIVQWHWKHVAGEDCDPWSEPEGSWHRWWKSLFPEDCQEVVIGPHRADVVTRDEIIELQHSPITGDEIAEREAFYGDRMVWVFYIGGFKDGVELTGGPLVYAFRFQFPKKAIASCKRRVIVDCGGGVLLEPRIWHDSRRGFGVVHDAEWLNPSTIFRGNKSNPVAPPRVRDVRILEAPKTDWRSDGETVGHRTCGYSIWDHARGGDGNICCPDHWRSFSSTIGFNDRSFLDNRCLRCNVLKSEHERIRCARFGDRIIERNSERW